MLQRFKRLHNQRKVTVTDHVKDILNLLGEDWNILAKSLKGFHDNYIEYESDGDTYFQQF